MTIMHHQDGIEMAQLAESKAVSAKVQAFAAKLLLPTEGYRRTAGSS
jgi:uncharacterized protein (DUF305 family)